METHLVDITTEQVWSALENVKDPEIPVVSVVDMGIITAVELLTSNSGLQTCVITMTPTFVGCPAIHVMKQSIQEEITRLGFAEVTVNVDLKTTWTSDRMKPE